MMTRQSYKDRTITLSFTEDELEALRDIAKDWLQLEPLSPVSLEPNALAVLSVIGLADFLEGPELTAVRRVVSPPIRTE